MLRHVNNQYPPLPIDMGGWALITDVCSRQGVRQIDKSFQNKDFLVSLATSEPSRFQLRVITTLYADSECVGGMKRKVIRIDAIRCTNGHSVKIDPKLLSTPLGEIHAKHISMFTHITKSGNIPFIIGNAVLPGSAIDHEGKNKRARRVAINLSIYARADPRNPHEGRHRHSE